MSRVENMVESTKEQTESLMKPLTRVQDLVGRPSTRIAIKVKGRIRFINSGDVVAIVAERRGKARKKISRNFPADLPSDFSRMK